MKHISFISQLTNVQITHFLDSLYPNNDGYSYSFEVVTNSVINFIKVIVYNSRLIVIANIELYDFYSNIANPKDWILFLSKTFGSEYNRAFLKYICPLSEDE